jgi:glycosyltransferase involved in cell wall biosynthesis
MNLSVVIPTYGRPDKITFTVDSIINNYSCENDKVEILVVDDNGVGSKYQIETQSILSTYINSREVKYIPLLENSGACVARNEGVKQSSSAYVTFLDDDDEIIFGALERKFNFFLANDLYDICCSDMLVRFDKNKKLRPASFVGDNALEFLLNGMCLTSMIMIKKESFLQIDGFTHCKKYQDHVLMLKSYLMGLKVCTFREATFIHSQEKTDFRISNVFSPRNYEIRKQFELELASNLVIDFKSRKRLYLRQGLFETKEYPSCSISTFRKIISLIGYVNNVNDVFHIFKRLLSKCLPNSVNIYLRKYL